MKKINKKEIKRLAKKIHPIYVMLKWTWFNKGIPSIKDIEYELENRVIDIMRGRAYRTTSGGLFAEIDELNAIHIGFEIKEFSGMFK